MSIQTRITVRFATSCFRCDRRIGVGEEAWWRAAVKRGRPARVTCEECYSASPLEHRTKFPFVATIVGSSSSYEVRVDENLELARLS